MPFYLVVKKNNIKVYGNVISGPQMEMRARLNVPDGNAGMPLHISTIKCSIWDVFFSRFVVRKLARSGVFMQLHDAQQIPTGTGYP